MPAKCHVASSYETTSPKAVGIWKQQHNFSASGDSIDNPKVDSEGLMHNTPCSCEAAISPVWPRDVLFGEESRRLIWAIRVGLCGRCPCWAETKLLTPDHCSLLLHLVQMCGSLESTAAVGGDCGSVAHNPDGSPEDVLSLCFGHVCDSFCWCFQNEESSSCCGQKSALCPELKYLSCCVAEHVRVCRHFHLQVRVHGCWA